MEWSGTRRLRRGSGLKALTRKRARPWISNEKSHSSVSSYAFALRVVHDVVHHAVDLLVVQRVDVDAAHVAMNPDHRGRPAERCKSDALFLTENASS